MTESELIDLLERTEKSLRHASKMIDQALENCFHEASNLVDLADEIDREIKHRKKFGVNIRPPSWTQKTGPARQLAPAVGQVLKK